MDKLLYQSLSGNIFTNAWRGIKNSFKSAVVSTADGNVTIDESGISVKSVPADNYTQAPVVTTSTDWFKILSIGIPVALLLFRRK